MDSVSAEFAQAWSAAGNHIETVAQGPLHGWSRAHPAPPFLAHLSPAALKAAETARMETVMKNFSIYKTIEMLLLIMGVGMIAFFQRHDVAAGIGVGLVLQAAFTLTLDIFAEARGADYLSAVQGIAI